MHRNIANSYMTFCSMRMLWKTSLNPRRKNARDLARGGRSGAPPGLTSSVALMSYSWNLVEVWRSAVKPKSQHYIASDRNPQHWEILMEILICTVTAAYRYPGAIPKIQPWSCSVRNRTERRSRTGYSSVSKQLDRVCRRARAFTQRCFDAGETRSPYTHH